MPLKTIWDPKLGEEVVVSRNTPATVVVMDGLKSTHFVKEPGPFFIKVVKFFTDDETGLIVHGQITGPEQDRRLRAESGRLQDKSPAIIKFWPDEMTVDPF
jgi:hypothetical protein